MINIPKVTKYHAKQIFNTWAKTGYLFDFGEKGGWFICEYLMYMKPALFFEHINHVEFHNKKFVFGGYQEFKIVDDDENLPTFSEYYFGLHSKGLINENSELAIFFKENFKETNGHNINNQLSTKNYILSYIAIENFKSFEKTNEFSFLPLTFITGKNNSGKSSILKSILFLKEIEYDSNIDAFVIRNVSELNIDVNEIKNNYNKSNQIIFSLNLNFYLKHFPKEELKMDYIFEIKNNFIMLVEFKIDFIQTRIEFDYIIKLSQSSQTNKKNLSINKSAFFYDDDYQYLEYDFKDIPGMGFNTLFNYENENLPLINLLESDSENKMFELLGDTQLSDLLATISFFFSKELKKSFLHIPSIRGENKRVFDSKNSTIGKAIKLLDDNKGLTEAISMINEWFARFDLLDKFIIKSKPDGSLELKFGDFNIADLGFGYMQIFTIIVQSVFASFIEKSIVFIEEPESNLHPFLQSILADFFMEINKLYGTQFIIETHSEYLIRKLQVLVKEDENNKELCKNIKIHYISKEKNFEIEIKENGFLNRPFEKGFYDVSINQIQKFQ